jgi:peptide/nickel transport system permease protein
MTAQRDDSSEPRRDGGRYTFEEVDWDQIDADARQITRQRIAWYLVAGTYFVALLYDVFSRYSATIYRQAVEVTAGTSAELVVPPGFLPASEPAQFPLVGPITPVNWLWSLTLLVGVFYVVIPLYKNKRMTAYYWQEFKKNKAAVISVIYLAIIFLIGLVVPSFITPPAVEPLQQLQPPVWGAVAETTPIQCVGPVSGGECMGTWEHPLGTTTQGKDILISVIYGMQISMQVGLIGMFLNILIASSFGLTAAYFGGYVDEILFRYVDIQITFPTFFLYLLIVYLIGGSLFVMILVFGLLGWGGIARIVRSEALQRREEEYILAAKNAGASGLWTMRRHLLPNVSNSVITAATLVIPGLILAEAALAFLGLGDPRIPSWGEVIAGGRGELDRAWWISTIPGVFLFVTILAFNFVGDALRDALDPRQGGS